jgi:serine acetyltransferase
VVIGAGSVVTKDIPDNSVAIGVPAKVVSSFDDFKPKSKPLVPVILSLQRFRTILNVCSVRLSFKHKNNLSFRFKWVL